MNKKSPKTGYRLHSKFKREAALQYKIFWGNDTKCIFFSHQTTISICAKHGLLKNNNNLLKFFKSLDPEGKGKIGVDQFLSMMEERLVISDWNEKDEERLFIKAFETLDPENTGKIPAAALR